MGLRNRHTQPVYYNELYDIEDFIGTSCLNNDDLHAPTFLWDSSICEESRDDDAERLLYNPYRRIRLRHHDYRLAQSLL